MSMRLAPIATALALACSGDPEPVQPPTGCDPTDPALCALPWPSSVFQVAADTPSGVQNAFSIDALPVNRDGVPLRPDALNELDGFSILTPLLTYIPRVSLDGTISHTDLGAYTAPDAKSVLLDTRTGERVPHFVELDATADEDTERLLILRPVVPLEHGRRYVVALRHLVEADGTPVRVSRGFAALRDGAPSTDGDVAARRSVYDRAIFPVLEDAGFPRRDLQLAWDFTTVSAEASLGKVLHMRDEALASAGSAGPAYTLDRIVDEDCGQPGVHVARTVEGHFTAPLYTDIDGPGAFLTRGPDGMPFVNGDTQVPFMVRIPCSLAEDPGSGGRVLQYGHGLLGGYGEARGGYLSELIDEHRWVLLAQDWTGMSEEDVGPITLMMAGDISDFSFVPERTQQGLVEWVLGLRMALGGLADDAALAFGGASVVDRALPPVYYGNSQGAILGGAYLALSPDLARGVLGVGGMPYSLLLSRSRDFDPFFLLFEQKYLDSREITMILAAVQTLWDPGESGGWAHQLDKPVLLQVAVGDAQVTTLGAHVAARAYGAELVAPGVRPVWGVEERTAPFDGSALVEWRYADGSMEPLANLPPDAEGDTHECPRREPAAQAQLAAFLETGTVEQHCDGPCEGVMAGLCEP